MRTRILSFWMLLAIVLSFLERVQLENGCATTDKAEVAPQAIIDSLMHMVALDSGFREYRFIELSEVARDNWSFPYNFEADFILDGPILSPDHSKIMAVYGDWNGPKYVLYAMIDDSSYETVDIQKFVPKRENYDVVWSENGDIVISYFDKADKLFSFYILGDHLMPIQVDFDKLGQTPVSLPLVSPDLEYIAYVRLIPWPGLGEELLTFSIKNQSSIVVAQGQSRYDLYYHFWSPKNQFIAVAHNRNLQRLPSQLSIVNLQGQTAINTSIDLGSDYTPLPSDFKWSPDGTKFFHRQKVKLDAEEMRGSRVLSPVDGILAEICIEGEGFWSPDSQYIAIFTETDQTEFEAKKIAGLYVYSIEEGVVYGPVELDTEMTGEIVGWGNSATPSE